MTLSDELLQAIEAGYTAMLQHAQHDLNLGYRQAIWAALGPHLDLSQGTEFYGWRRRTLLAIASARHVLPIWEQVWSTDDVPHRALAAAGNILNGTADTQTGKEIFQWCWRHMDDLTHRFGYQNPEAVGRAAACALSTALYDEQFDASHIDPNLTDAEIDPYDRDASWAAVVAYANGPIRDPNSDQAKRRRFWEWWLKEAVPSAWNAVQE